MLERAYNPGIRRGLIQLAEQSRGDAAVLQAAAERQFKRLVKRAGPAKATVAIRPFLRQPPALQRQMVWGCQGGLKFWIR